MPNIQRYVEYKIEKSILTLGDVSAAVDYNNPLTYKQWLGYFTDITTSIHTYESQYTSYLEEWNEVKNKTLAKQSNEVKEKYVQLFKEIQLDVVTEQERQFLAAVDYEDTSQVETVIPLITTKIKSLIDYYKNFREVVKTQPKRNNLFSSNLGIRTFLLQTLSDLLNYDSDTIDLSNKFDIDKTNVLNNASILIEDLYDEYTDYFDLTTQLPASSYSYGGEVRETEWNANTNEWDFDLFFDYNKSVVRLLSSYNYLLSGFSDNLAVQIGLSAEDIVSYSSEKDYKDNIKTDDLNDLNLTDKIKLFQKFLGTDWYLLSTGSSVTNYLSSLMVKADNISSNYLNRNNVSTATTPNTAFLVSQKDIGGFYTPNYLGILNYNSFDYNFTVNTNLLSSNSVYFFPDPNKFILTKGNSQYKNTGTIFNVQENAYYVCYNIANGYAFGFINDKGYYANFNGYQNLEETTRIYNSGISMNYDRVDFFKGTKSDVWSNEDVYQIQKRAGFPTDERQDKLIVGQADIINYSSDIFGNQYGGLKRVNDPIFIDKESSENQIKERFLMISNYLYLNQSALTAFNYSYDSGNVYDKFVEETFTRTGLSAYGQDADTNALNLFSRSDFDATLSLGRFNMDWTSVDRVFYNKNGLFDGITFTGFNDVLYPDSPRPSSASWKTTSDVYYNLLLEAGPNLNGTRGTFINESSFLASISAVKDCGLFIYKNQIDPWEQVDGVVNRHEKIPYSSYQIPSLTSTYVTETPIENESIYSKKYVLSAYPYFRNISNKVMPLSAGLSAIFTKYSALSNIEDELNNNITKFDIVYDVGIFETPNYLVIEKINFDYETETVLPYTSKLNYIERTDKDSSLEQFGDFYFHERTNSFLLYKTTLLSNLSSSVYKTFYPTIYKYEIDSLKFREIYPQKSKNLVGELSAFSFTSLAPNNLITYIQDLSSANDVDIVYEVIDIDRPNLSYDPNTNNYGLTIKARDNSDALAIYYQTYKFIDGQFNNSINEIYFQQGVIRDESYTTPLTAGFLHYSKLDVAPAIASWTGKEGVLKLGE